MSNTTKQNKPGMLKGSLSPNIFNQINSLNLRGFNKVNNIGTWRPINFQAKSGGSAITRHNTFSHGSGYGCTPGSFSKERSHSRDTKKHSLLTTNEKETMKLLNDRLASYLDKVRSLEEDNTHLEKKIRDWYDQNHPQMLPDFSHYFESIEKLQNEILKSTMENTRVSRQVDNTRLAAEDFRNKYKMEVKLKADIEQDMKALRYDLDSLKHEVEELDVQHEKLQQEILHKKKTNEDTVNSLYSQLGARVTVEVDAPPTADLSKMLSEIREQYEDLMESNKTQAEKWFLAKSEKLKYEIDPGSSEQFPTFQSEIIELKRTVQALEIEHQSELSMKSALENTLTEKKASYSSQLSQLQDMISQVEANLSQIRANHECQNEDHKALMYETMHLEREITTYRFLIDKQDIQ
ncbi:keratin, type I cytoskeletal 19-like [Mixophyes fleayi]|uniref:keratin, type I cytoskeletal 19-like n=1 Tax=Mixophyes fleayi TaxID=3061075 RepID=UPI003F4E07E9